LDWQEVLLGSPDPLVLLARAVDQAADLVTHAGDQQAHLPTPCRSWNVQALIEHLIDDLDQFTVAAAGGSPDWSGPVPPVAGDWGSAFRDRAPRLLAAWREAGDLTATIQLPIGDLPAAFVVDPQIAEFAVHSWDLASATGQDYVPDPDVASHALQWARTALLPEYRGTEESGLAFGPEVATADELPASARLAAFFGRDPTWHQ
jgi:uncharacterized protein (TIGR03086 family)